MWGCTVFNKKGVIIMDKSKKQILITLALLPILLIVWLNMFKTMGKARKRTKQAKVMQEQTADTDAGSFAFKSSEQNTQGSLPSGQGLEWGTDPFSGKRIDMGAGASTSLKLSGIVYNSENPDDSYAIIGNSTVSVGEYVGNSQIKVISITEREVTVSDGVREKKLKVW